MFEKKESYTPAEAKRAYNQLKHLVAENTLTPETFRFVESTLPP